MVRVEAPGSHRVVLVEVEGDDVGEAEPFLAVHADQLAVGADRRGSGGQAKHGGLPGAGARADHLGDPPRDETAELVVVAHDDGADALEAAGVGYHLLTAKLGGTGQRDNWRRDIRTAVIPNAVRDDAITAK
jgi:hypothetical protein